MQSALTVSTESESSQIPNLMALVIGILDAPIQT